MKQGDTTITLPKADKGVGPRKLSLVTASRIASSTATSEDSLCGLLFQPQHPARGKTMETVTGSTFPWDSVGGGNEQVEHKGCLQCQTVPHDTTTPSVPLHKVQH